MIVLGVSSAHCVQRRTASYHRTFAHNSTSLQSRNTRRNLFAPCRCKCTLLAGNYVSTFPRENLRPVAVLEESEATFSLSLVYSRFPQMIINCAGSLGVCFISLCCLTEKLFVARIKAKRFHQVSLNRTRAQETFIVSVTIFIHKSWMITNSREIFCRAVASSRGIQVDLPQVRYRRRYEITDPSSAGRSTSVCDFRATGRVFLPRRDAVSRVIRVMFHGHDLAATLQAGELCIDASRVQHESRLDGRSAGIRGHSRLGEMADSLSSSSRLICEGVIFSQRRSPTRAYPSRTV